MFNSMRKPRGFNHQYIYVNERKEKLDKMEEKAKRGEVISLSALAAAVKTEDGRTPQRDPDGKKPSIRAQLKADRAQSCKPQQREKKQEAKRSIRQALEME